MMRGRVVVLAALAVVLSVGVGLELRDGSEDEGGMNTALSRAGSPGSVPATTVAVAPLGAARPIEGWVQTVLGRPLFAPNRRPAAGAAPGVVATSLPRVAGIMVNGGGRSVIFAAADGGRPLVVGEGAEVSGFRVQSIELGQVTVVGRDGPVVLRPSFDPAPRAVATVQPGVSGPLGLPGFGAPVGTPVGTPVGAGAR